MEEQDDLFRMVLAIRQDCANAEEYRAMIRILHADARYDWDKHRLAIPAFCAITIQEIHTAAMAA
jgi:hypothetical protein